MMDSLWNGVVQFGKNSFTEPWTVAREALAEPFKHDRVLLNCLTFLCAFMILSVVRGEYPVLIHNYDRFTIAKGEVAKAAEKKKALDRLAAATDAWKNSSGWLSDEGNVLVDVRDADQTKPLLTKSSERGPKKLNITIFFTGNVPKFEVDKLVRLFKAIFAPSAGEEDVVVNCLGGRNALQADVEFRESTLSDLELLREEASKIDGNCAFQIDCWGILKGDGTKQLFRKAKMPTIFHAEYAAGLLTIAGKFLEGADIIAGNSQQSIQLEEIYRKDCKSLAGSSGCFGWRRYSQVEVVEIVMFPIRLSSEELENLSVYATKSMELDGESFPIHSSITPVKDALWDTVLKVWIIRWVTMAYCAWGIIWFVHFVTKWISEEMGQMYAFWFLIALTQWIRHLLEFLSVDKALKTHAQDVVRAFRTLYFGILDVINREAHLPVSRSTSS